MVWNATTSQYCSLLLVLKYAVFKSFAHYSKFLKTPPKVSNSKYVVSKSPRLTPRLMKMTYVCFDISFLGFTGLIKLNGKFSLIRDTYSSKSRFNVGKSFSNLGQKTNLLHISFFCSQNWNDFSSSVIVSAISPDKKPGLTERAQFAVSRFEVRNSGKLDQRSSVPWITKNVFLILLYVSCSKSDKQPNSTKITYDKIYFLVVLTEFAGVAVKASLLPATDLDQLHALLMPNPGPLVLRQSARNTQSE